MKLEDFKNKKVAVLGFGVEGESATRFLLKNGAEVSVFDVREENKIDQDKVAEFKKKGVNFRFNSYPESFSGFDLAVRSPGISVDSAVVEKIKKENVEVTSSTKIFFDLCPCKIIGVTGTKGKSTTSTLIFEMLKEQGMDVYLGGNIGISPLDFLEDLKPDSHVVLELSSFQLQDLGKSPQIAVFLMVTSEHLDYHQDFEQYINAKRNILRYQTPSDFAIINHDYPVSNESDILTEGQIYYFSRLGRVDRGCFVKEDAVWVHIEDHLEKIIDTKEILLRGRHNLENVCAAVMVSELVGVQLKSIVQVLKSFKGLEHRLELVGEYREITFYNDSLATVPEATTEALEALGENVETLIAGGYDRGLDYKELGKYITNSTIKNLILFPTTGAKIWAVISELVPNERVRPQKYDVGSMREAVVTAFQTTHEGKICLMSPGASSFNLFKNYKDRGDQFKHEVESFSG